MTQMSKPDVVIAAAYSRWLNTILETHAKQLWDAADGDLDDDELNENWELLPEQLRRRLWGLSSDLFSLVDNEKFSDADWEPIPLQELANRLEESFQKRQWDEVLDLLRRRPRFVASDHVSYIRGRAWQELGQHDVALKFFDNASRLKPGHAPYRILALESLKAACDWQEAISRANQYSLDPTSSPSLLFRAGDVFHAYSMTGGEDQGELAKRAVDVVNQGLDKLVHLGTEQPPDSILVAALVTKAFCLERLGRFDEALSTYDAGIQRFPGNPELLTARGLLRLEHDMGGSIDDFRSAVKLFARSVWPYLELARNEFSHHKYDDVLELCRLGLERANRDADAALMFDLRALALFEKNDSAVAIERAFQTAVSLDPFNLAIRHNYDRFLIVSGHPNQPVSGDWELSPLPIEEERRVLYQSVQPSFALAA